MKLSLVPVSLLLLLGMSCSPITIDSNSVKLSLDDKVNLSAVTFAYDKWSKSDEKFLKKMKEKEARWRELITDNFNAKANSLGLNEGSGATVPVEITIIDLNPGSRAGRMFFGGLGGAGIISAMAKAGEGTIYASGELTGGNYGGNFDSVIKALGRDIAGAIGETRK
jgi:hypothetical protein